jgi:lipoate-protein ligase A
MSKPVRLLDIGPMSARRNVAITAALAELHRAGQIHDTLRLYTSPPAVLIGRHQPLADAVCVRAGAPPGIEIARRITGGGAFYVDERVLAWDLVAERYRFGDCRRKINERICSGIAAGLARFGLPARFRPLGDVEIDGRRIAQSSGTIDDPTVVYQGTVLIDPDPAEMAKVLRLPRASNVADARASIAARVTTLAEWLGRVPPMGEVKGLLAAGLSHSWRREFQSGELTAAELSLADRLLDQGIVTADFTARLAVSATAREKRAGKRAATRMRPT